MAAPAVSSSFTISEWPFHAATCSAVAPPICGQYAVEQLIHLFITLGVMQVKISSDQDMDCIQFNDYFLDKVVVVIFRFCLHYEHYFAYSPPYILWG